MKKYGLILLALMAVILASLLLVGCGVSKSDYNELLSQKTTLETEKQTLQSQYDSLQAEKDTLAAEKDDLEADYGQLSADYSTLQADFQALAGEKDAVQAQYAAVNDELAAIREVYPPRDFSSLLELEDWLLANDVSDKPVTSTAEAWIGRALEVQEDALADGYVVSVDYDGPDAQGFYSVFCTTIINGNIYYWDPETDDVSKDTSLDTVK